MFKRATKGIATEPVVLMIISGMGCGGRERQLYEILSGLRERIRFHVVILNDNLDFPLEDLGVSYFVISKNERLNPKAVFRVVKYILTCKPDIIHYWDMVSAFFVLWFKAFTQIKFVNGSIRYGGKVKRSTFAKMLRYFFFQMADVIVANSKAGLIAEGFESNPKAHVIYNGINSSPILDAKAHNSIHSGHVRIIMVANFSKAKDHVTAIEACINIARDNQDLEFVFIGEGPNRYNIEQMVPAGIRNQFDFTGSIPDVSMYVAASDIGLLLTNIQGHAEGISNSIMEYMAAGLPVIASKCGGTLELVQDGITGFLVEDNRVELVIDDLLMLISNQSLRCKMGQAGRDRIIQNFNLKAMSDQYQDIYLSLIT